jgi:hypothetical protein
MEKQRKIEEAKQKEEELKMKEIQAQLVSYHNSLIFPLKFGVKFRKQELDRLFWTSDFRLSQRAL